MGILRAPLLLNEPSAQVIKGSLKCKASGYLTRTPGSAGNRRKWTWSIWVKRSAFGSSLMSRFFQAGSTSVSSGNAVLAFYQDSIFFQIDSSSARLQTSGKFRDIGWYHIVVATDTTQSTSSDRVKIYVNGSQLSTYSTEGYPSQNLDTAVNNTERHILCAGADSSGNVPDGAFDGYLAQAYQIDGLALGPGYFGFSDPLTNTWRPKKFRAEGTTVNDGTVWSSGIPGNTLSGYPATNAFDGNTSNYVYADVSSTMTWTAPKRITGQLIEVYVYAGNTHPIVLVNGKSTGAVVGGAAQQGVWVDVTDLCGGPGGVLETITAYGQNIGGVDRQSGFSAVAVDGVILTDNTTQNLSFGTNGFYLPMDNQDDFEKDKSGNANDFTKNSFSGTSIDPDIVKDSPSGAVFGGRSQTGITTTSSAPGNYATLNPLSNVHGTLSESNLEAQSDTSGQYSLIPSTLLINKTGKFYWEAKFNTGSTDDAKYATIGICSESRKMTTNQGLTAANDVGDYAIKGWDGGFRTMTNQSITYNNGSNHGNTLNNNDVVSLAFNADNGKLWFGVNGTYLTNAAGVGNPSLDLNPDLTAPTDIGHYPAFGAYNSDGQSSELHVNFGQKPFKYAPPQGFLPLNSATVRPNKVIPRPDQYVGVVTYTGTGSAFDLDYNFSPDFAWVKGYTYNSSNHQLSDTVRNRAAGGNRRFELPGTAAQDGGGPGFINSGLNINTNAAINTNNQSYTAWCWKAGGNKNTFNVDDVGYASAAAAGLTAGSVTPTGASVGTKQGFSIIKWTAPNPQDNSATIPHGLTQKPDFWAVKSMTGTGEWICYTEQVDGTLDFGHFNNADAFANSSATAPTATTFGVYGNDINTAGEDVVAYLWHSVPGLQKFGSYTGNGSSDGPYVELGFRPTLLWIKNTDTGNETWCVHDDQRDKFNPAKHRLSIETSDDQDASQSARNKDFLSNGFKIRGTSGEQNTSGDQYIYCAWAEAPASNLFGGQSNAR